MQEQGHADNEGRTKDTATVRIRTRALRRQEGRSKDSETEKGQEKGHGEGVREEKGHGDGVRQENGHGDGVRQEKGHDDCDDRNEDRLRRWKDLEDVYGIIL